MAHRMLERDSIRYRNCLTLDSRNGFNSQVNMVMRSLATQTTNNEYLRNLKHSVIQYRFAGSPNLKTDPLNILETLVKKPLDISSSTVMSSELISPSPVLNHCNGTCRRNKSYRTRSESTLSSVSSNSESRCDSFCSEYRENSDSDKDITDAQRCERDGLYESHSTTLNSLISGCSDYHSYSSSGEILSDYTDIKQSLCIPQAELAEKCNRSLDIIVVNKDRQVAEPNKSSSIRLEQLDQEKESEEAKQQATQRKRERRKQKKRAKQEKHTDFYFYGDYDEDENDDNDSMNQKNFGNNDLINNSDIRGLTLQSEDKSTIRLQSLTNEIIDKNGVLGAFEDYKNVLLDLDEVQSSRPDTSSQSFTLQDPLSLPKYCSANASENGMLVTGRRKKKKKFTSKVIESVCQRPVLFHKCSNSVDSSRRNSVESTRCASIEQPVVISVEPFKNKSSSNQQSFHHTTTNNVSTVNCRTNNRRSPRKGRSDRRGNCTSDRNINDIVVDFDEDWKVVAPKRVSITIPKKEIGKIIGQAGNTINTIRLLSGAHIDIDNKETDIGERSVQIRGTADSVKKAKLMIDDVLNGKSQKDMFTTNVKGSAQVYLSSSKSTTNSLYNSLRCRRKGNANMTAMHSTTSTNAVASKPLPICGTTTHSSNKFSRYETHVSGVSNNDCFSTKALTPSTGEIMNFASVAAAGVVSTIAVNSQASSVPVATLPSQSQPIIHNCYTKTSENIVANHSYHINESISYVATSRNPATSITSTITSSTSLANIITTVNSNRIFSRAPGFERHRIPECGHANTNQLQKIYDEKLSFSDGESSLFSNMTPSISNCGLSSDHITKTLSSSSIQNLVTLPHYLSESNVEHSVQPESFCHYESFMPPSSGSSQPVFLSLSDINQKYEKERRIEHHNFEVHCHNISLQRERPQTKKEFSLKQRQVFKTESSVYRPMLDSSSAHMSRGDMMTLPRTASSLNPSANSFEPRLKAAEEIGRTNELNHTDFDFIDEVAQLPSPKSVDSSPYVMQYDVTSDASLHFNSTSISTNLQTADANVDAAMTLVQLSGPPRPIGAERRRDTRSDRTFSSPIYQQPQTTAWQIGEVDSDDVANNLSSWTYHIANSATFQNPQESIQEILAASQQQLTQHLPFHLGFDFEFEQQYEQWKQHVEQ